MFQSVRSPDTEAEDFARIAKQVELDLQEAAKKGPKAFGMWIGTWLWSVDAKAYYAHVTISNEIS